MGCGLLLVSKFTISTEVTSLRELKARGETRLLLLLLRPAWEAQTLHLTCSELSNNFTECEKIIILK